MPNPVISLQDLKFASGANGRSSAWRREDPAPVACDSPHRGLRATAAALRRHGGDGGLLRRAVPVPAVPLPTVPAISLPTVPVPTIPLSSPGTQSKSGL